MTVISVGEHAERVAAWRRLREDRLRSPHGWLALVGLHWLTPGENHFGAHPSNEIVLHGSGMAPRAGTLTWTDGQVRLQSHEGADVRIGGDSAASMVLADDRDGDPTMLDLGPLRMHLIRRGERMGLRVRDSEAPALTAFAGLESFPIDPSWRVTAQFEPAPPGATIKIVDITGTPSREATPGTIWFDRDGATWRLRALPGGGDGALWLVFGDLTNGHETYAGGRFLYTEAPAADGTVIADFNLAYNPPCVFSPYATCPLPPPQNRLALRIEAGERQYTSPL
ncbi:MAG: DUF1684 domain-containing protein [Chloroflexota bacterium]|nr:DUF1684 domain-containing protein [Chloroflexota bacterium]